jgi:hypothetical protein
VDRRRFEAHPDVSVKSVSDLEPKKRSDWIQIRIPQHWIEGPALIITDPNPGGATTANTVRFLLFFEPERR